MSYDEKIKLGMTLAIIFSESYCGLIPAGQTDPSGLARSFYTRVIREDLPPLAFRKIGGYYD